MKMKTNNNLFNIKTLLFLCLIVSMFNACDDDEKTYEKTRLFQPVLNQSMFSEGNSIILDMGSLKGAIGYTIEVSQDSFQTDPPLYTILSDTNYVEINENTVGEELLWNSLYQVRVTAHEADSQYDSKTNFLGSVKTQTFPSVLNSPASYDVIDVAARVSWDTMSNKRAITGIKVFGPAIEDPRLQTPLLPEFPVTQDQSDLGEIIINGLEPSSEYQVAIYSEDELRGWVNYNTLEKELDYTTVSNLIDLRDNVDRGAVSSALQSAPDGATILISRGFEYDAPGMRLNNSVTIRSAYGFGKQKARLIFDSNFDLETDANIDHVRFIDLELRGTDWGGKYVINISKAATLNEFSFDKCYITNFRGIYRQKDSPSVVNNYIVNNSIVDSIGGYGVASCDNDGAMLKNITLTNSTFNHTIYFLVSKNNSETVTIDGCTIANAPEKGRQLFRWRTSGQDNVTGGITISNTIFGHGFNQTEGEEDYAIKGKQGLENTNITVNNTFTVTDFSFVSDPIGEIPIGNANKPQRSLWVDAENNNFNFLGSDFIGRTSAGDPRWRTEL